MSGEYPMSSTKPLLLVDDPSIALSMLLASEAFLAAAQILRFETSKVVRISTPPPLLFHVLASEELK